MRAISVLVVMTAIALAPAAAIEPLLETAPRTLDHCEPGEVHVNGVGCVDPTPCPPDCRHLRP